MNKKSGCERQDVKDVCLIARNAIDRIDELKERLIRIMGTFDLATGHADTFDELLDSLESELRDVLGHYRRALGEPVAWMQVTSYGNKLLSFTEPPANPPCYTGVTLQAPINYPLYIARSL